jgi:hypothetical protein
MAVSRSNIINSSIETAGDRGVGLLFLLPSNTVSTANSVRLAYRRETGEASSHGRYAQTDLMGSHRAVPIKGFAQGGDPDATSSAHCAAKKIAEEGRVQQFRPSGFCRSLSDRHDRQIDGTGSAQIRKRITQRGVAAGSIRQECLDHVVVFGERHLGNAMGKKQRAFGPWLAAKSQLRGRETRSHMTKKEPDNKQEARDQLTGEIDAMFDRHVARWKGKLPSDVVVILFQTILLQKAVLSAVLTGQTKETVLQVAGDYCDAAYEVTQKEKLQ